MLPLAQVIQKHKINYHNYADDSQLYISLSAADLDPIRSRTQCIDDNNLWMSENFLQLNKDKAEILIFGAKAEKRSSSQTSEQK